MGAPGMVLKNLGSKISGAGVRKFVRWQVWAWTALAQCRQQPCSAGSRIAGSEREMWTGLKITRSAFLDGQNC